MFKKGAEIVNISICDVNMMALCLFITFLAEVESRYGEDLENEWDMDLSVVLMLKGSRVYTASDFVLANRIRTKIMAQMKEKDFRYL